MDRVIKSKWLEALRSGNYEQGKERLFSPETNSFCCLGVLCYIMGVDLLEKIESDEYDGVHDVLGDTEYPPQNVLDVAGLSQQQAVALASMNDGLNNWKDCPKSFEEIADYIDGNL